VRKLLAVYNVCGIGGKERENVPYYIDCVRSLIAQDIEPKHSQDYKIVVSGCMTSDRAKMNFVNYFGDTISFNWIEDPVPLSISFNHSVEQMVNQYGDFDCYLYIDSGISFWDPMERNDALRALYNKHKSGPYAITACKPSNDDGQSWWKIKYREGEDYIYPIGKCTNMHCQIFSNEFKKAYGRILPDIFANNTMESTFSHLCAAISRKYLFTQKPHLLHNHSMDGASIGFRNHDILFKTTKTMDERYREGVEYGFGYEEYRPTWLHNPEKFDENGYAKDPMLLEFLKKELYLTKEQFDYSQVRNMFIPSRE
jgi:hypothetical protein